MVTDIEQLLIDELTGPAQVPVSTRTLEQPEFVRVLRTGGAAMNRIQDRATVVTEAWAQTESAAIDLAERCRDTILHGLSGNHSGVMVYGVEELGGPANLPPAEGGYHRYTMTHEIKTRRRRTRSTP